MLQKIKDWFYGEYILDQRPSLESRTINGEDWSYAPDLDRLYHTFGDCSIRVDETSVTHTEQLAETMRLVYNDRKELFKEES